MSSILMKGVIRNGRVETAEPINLPDGSEVTISGHAHGKFPGLSDNDRPMTPSEIAETLAAMDKVEPFDMTVEPFDMTVEPFDMTDEERVNADAWEKKVNDYTIANMDRGIEDVFP